MNKGEKIKSVIAWASERLSDIENRSSIVISDFKENLRQKRLKQVSADLGISPNNK